MIGHVSSSFPGAQDHRTRSSTVNKSPSESMSFITEVICKFIFADVHMRNNYRPNRALVLGLHCVFSSVLILARVSWINPLPSHSDSVCTSLGLLLVYLDYLSALPCWILFADRRPTLAPRILLCLALNISVYWCLTLPVFDHVLE